MAQTPLMSDLAAVTHLLPGPTMMSHASTPPTPYAIVAIACTADHGCRRYCRHRFQGTVD